eukprot:TRINITY_DN9421_c0_g1_i1.p1 TRINITY_DN9421_c0_g1~~TRINITY_DN9421_c0_g1_i1.p1  ORF type:complete len:154 (+),score=30.81 TRINITY_DN9421_c0_g1_i1:42-503(+)
MAGSGDTRRVHFDADARAFVHRVTVARTSRGTQADADAGSAYVDPLRYKTSLCRAHQEGHECRFGVRCVFAHGPAELRSPHINAVTLRHIPSIQSNETSSSPLRTPEPARRRVTFDPRPPSRPLFKDSDSPQSMQMKSLFGPLAELAFSPLQA